MHDIKVDNAKLKDSKKITLNLGAGMKKKTKADDQPWNAFGGANDFPSFFEGAPAPAKITPKPEAFNLLDVDHSQEKQQ